MMENFSPSGYVLMEYENFSENIKRCLASYLSTGNLEDLTSIPETDVVLVRLFAKRLRLKTLHDHCNYVLHQAGSKNPELRRTVSDSVCEIRRKQNIPRAVCCHGDPRFLPTFVIIIYDTKQTTKHKTDTIVLDVRKDFFPHSTKIQQLRNKTIGHCSSGNILGSPYVFFTASDGKATKREFFLYDILLGKWRSCGRIDGQRRLVNINDAIYSFGGKDNLKIEKYDAPKEDWHMVAHLKHTISNASCAVCSGKVYIFSGEPDWMYTIQCFNPVCNTVESFSSRIPILSKQTIGIRNSIYSVSDSGQTSRLDPHSYQCFPLTSVDGKDFHLFSLDGEIYMARIVKGEDRPRTVICRYNHELGEWKDFVKIDSGPCIKACCVVNYSQKCGPVIPFMKYDDVQRERIRYQSV